MIVAGAAVAKSVGKAIWEFLAGIPWQAWALAAVALAFWWHGSAMYERGVIDTDTAWKATVEKERRVAREKALATERRHADALDAVESKLILERAKGYEERERVIADLRAGTLRLRKQWQGCRADLSKAGAGAGGGDGDAELRAAGAGDLVRIGREADAKLAACQAVIRADREAVGVQGD